MTKRLVVVGVFDSAMQAYAPPVFVPSTGVAIRSFADQVNNKNDNNNLYMHPEDFELRMLAEFDEETGVFYAGEGVVVLCRGKDLKHVSQ